MAIGAGWWWLPASEISTEVFATCHSNPNCLCATREILQTTDVLWDPGHAVLEALDRHHYHRAGVR
jgi:hypothetical protein